jgi:hypothetical protein
LVGNTSDNINQHWLSGQSLPLIWSAPSGQENGYAKTGAGWLRHQLPGLCGLIQQIFEAGETGEKLGRNWVEDPTGYDRTEAETGTPVRGIHDGRLAGSELPSRLLGGFSRPSNNYRA